MVRGEGRADKPRGRPRSWYPRRKAAARGARRVWGRASAGRPGARPRGDAVQGRAATAVVDFDLWGAFFFGELWGEGAGGGSVDERPGGGRKAGKAPDKS